MAKGVDIFSISCVLFICGRVGCVAGAAYTSILALAHLQYKYLSALNNTLYIHVCIHGYVRTWLCAYMVMCIHGYVYIHVQAYATFRLMYVVMCHYDYGSMSVCIHVVMYMAMYVVTWLRGYVVMWLRGYVVTWLCGYVVMYTSPRCNFSLH